MEKSYNITIQTPLGNENGKIIFIINNGTLNGTLEIMGSKNNFSNGEIRDNTFEFSGEIRKLITKRPYKVNGTFEDNSLTAFADTKYGLLSIKGKEI